MSMSTIQNAYVSAQKYLLKLVQNAYKNYSRCFCEMHGSRCFCKLCWVVGVVSQRDLLL